MKAYQAYGADSSTFTADTPRKAALGFFSAFPNKRKCNVIEGETDGIFFTVRYGRKSEGQWPSYYKDVTKKAAADLPDSEEN